MVKQRFTGSKLDSVVRQTEAAKGAVHDCVTLAGRDPDVAELLVWSNKGGGIDLGRARPGSPCASSCPLVPKARRGGIIVQPGLVTCVHQNHATNHSYSPLTLTHAYVADHYEYEDVYSSMMRSTHLSF